MKYLCFILIILNVWACRQQSAAENDSHDKIIKEVTKMLNDYHQAIEVGGLEAEFSFLDDSEAFFWVPPGYRTALDFDSVAAILRDNDSRISQMVLHWDTLQVWPLREDLAQFYGTIHSHMEDTAKVVTEGYLVETGLVVKRRDGWKLLNGQSAFFTPE